MPSNLEQIVRQLTAHRWVLVSDWLDSVSHGHLVAEARACTTAGTMRTANTGRGTDSRPGIGSRGDSLQWLDHDKPSDPVRALLGAVSTLREQLNAITYLNLVEFEAHFAHYPIGTGYQRHLDRFRSDDSRVISAIIHLGDPWQAEHGGELRLYVDNDGPKDFVDLPPHPGQLILFLSADIEHEVLTTHRDRYSIAGWLRQRSRA